MFNSPPHLDPVWEPFLGYTAPLGEWPTLLDLAPLSINCYPDCLDRDSNPF